MRAVRDSGEDHCSQVYIMLTAAVRRGPRKWKIIVPSCIESGKYYPRKC